MSDIQICHFSFLLTSCKQSVSLLSATHLYRESTGDQCKHSEQFLNVQTGVARKKINTLLSKHSSLFKIQILQIWKYKQQRQYFIFCHNFTLRILSLFCKSRYSAWSGGITAVTNAPEASLDLKRDPTLNGSLWGLKYLMGNKRNVSLPLR